MDLQFLADVFEKSGGQRVEECLGAFLGKQRSRREERREEREEIEQRAEQREQRKQRAETAERECERERMCPYRAG